MKDRILLVGQNVELLATRAMLLADWKTVIALPAEAMRTLGTESFQGVVLCHSVEPSIAEAIVAQASMSESGPAILAIRLPSDPELSGAKNHLSDLWESPAWLRAEMSSLLADRNLAV